MKKKKKGNERICLYTQKTGECNYFFLLEEKKSDECQ
jgi:hypothetical protein